MCVVAAAVSVEGSGSASKRIDALRSGIDNALQTVVAWNLRWRRGERAHYFAGSTDRFELERRERAWNRWHSSDGSLLGR